jgi:O-antigen/teichoic acid export membrane protein
MGLTGTVTNLIVSAQLGARGIGLFAWCTILATPISGVLFSVHGVSTPTLARMRRDDGTRYEESVRVVTRTMASVSALCVGCLIGLTGPTIRYVFGDRWLPATGAVQFCLAGLIPTAILAALASDANAREMRRASAVSAAAGGAATLIALVPLSSLDGVAGASAADNCVGPIVAVAVFVWALRPPVIDILLRTLRLLVPLLAVSFLTSRLVHTPLEFAGACVTAGIAGLVGVFLAEGELLKRLIRLLRTRTAPPAGIEAVASDGAVLP